MHYQALSSTFTPFGVASLGVECSTDRALFSAVLSGNPLAVQEALEAGANPSAKTLMGFRPLHISAVAYANANAQCRSAGHWDAICASLIAAGAEVLALDSGTVKWGTRFGETAAQRAAAIGSLPPSLSRATNTPAMLAKLDGRPGELDGDGVWRETPQTAAKDGQRVKRPRRAGRLWKGKSGVLNTRNEPYKSAFR